jgi:hypothetical protein
MPVAPRDERQAMGLLGGFLPALRAARLGIVEALRAS